MELTPISFVLIFIELILRKFKYIKSECTNIVDEKIKKTIYGVAVTALIYILWYWIYYNPILEKQMQFD